MNTEHSVKTLEWVGSPTKGALKIVNQRHLPEELRFELCVVETEIYDAIKKLKVRGASAIGVAAAYGVVLAAINRQGLPEAEYKKSVLEAIKFLSESRPTAVNLFWALDKMKKVVERSVQVEDLLNEAQAIEQFEKDSCQAIGNYGNALIPEKATILTHCNAGALATVGLGTALAPIYVAAEKGKRIRVIADETRPLLQGARLTAFELSKAEIPVTVITDSMSAHVMSTFKIDLVIVGADRIAANGDTANKVGTFLLALAAKYHGVPFYVAASTPTFDRKLETGKAIPIEHRHRDEITKQGIRQVVPKEARVYNCAFDVTPNHLISGFITEKGLITDLSLEGIAKVLDKKG